MTPSSLVVGHIYEGHAPGSQHVTLRKLVAVFDADHRGRRVRMARWEPVTRAYSSFRCLLLTSFATWAQREGSAVVVSPSDAEDLRLREAEHFTAVERAWETGRAELAVIRRTRGDHISSRERKLREFLRAAETYMAARWVKS